MAAPPLPLSGKAHTNGPAHDYGGLDPSLLPVPVDSVAVASSSGTLFHLGSQGRTRTLRGICMSLAIRAGNRGSGTHQQSPLPTADKPEAAVASAHWEEQHLRPGGFPIHAGRQHTPRFAVNCPACRLFTWRAADMGYAVRDENRHTYADYLGWPEDIRYELIDGRAFLMSPAPTLDHQTIVFEVGYQIRAALEGRPCRVLTSPVDVLLDASPSSDPGSSTTVVQPDVLVVCDPSKLMPRGVRGAPDWVLEVLSPGSASHDHITKVAAYEKAGVREYWIAHPTDRIVTIYRHDGTAYGRPRVVVMSGETPVDVLPGIVVRWDPIVNLLVAAPA